jgi:non-ribosomal peptide synthetase component F
LFFDGSLSGATYERWLRDNGVTYVALPGARLSWVARPEASLIRAGQPYLTEVWRGGDWTLYEVSGRPSIVDGGTLVSTGPSEVTVEVPAGETLVRVRYTRWLRADGARLSRAPGGWTLLRASAAGRYTIGS